VEGIFQEKFGAWDRLDAFMEYSLGLWSHDLGPLVLELLEEGHPFLLLAWQAEGVQYYSLLFSPCGFLVFELISSKLDPAGQPVVEHPNPRMVWRDWNDQYIAEAPYLTPLKAPPLPILDLCPGEPRRQQPRPGGALLHRHPWLQHRAPAGACRRCSAPVLCSAPPPAGLP
jgi:hypothetical protein